nr:MAG TPA: hypothetical protein [Caudoviricetes sp.]
MGNTSGDGKSPKSIKVVLPAQVVTAIPRKTL